MQTVDAKYYGNAMHVGRRAARLSRREVAQILKMPTREYSKIEAGKHLPSESMIYRLMAHAFVGLSTRYRITEAMRPKRQ